MKVIEELQGQRPQMVHLFDEVVKAIPDGVYLTSIKQSGTSVAIEGIAQSNARVSAFMRNIDASHWLAEPKLDVIEALSGKNDQKGSKFKLNLKEVMEGESSATDGMPKDKAAKSAAKPVAPGKAGVKTGKKS
jgi:type IV pilus assembly protein PilN